jgi:hypothetical protein
MNPTNIWESKQISRKSGHYISDIVHITANVVSSNPAHGEVHNIM